MILPQVHLRKPCYDFYFLQAIQFGRLLGHERIPNPVKGLVSSKPIRGPHWTVQSIVATGGVYKGQGRNQHELMIRAY